MRSEPDKLARKGFALSGFSFGALVFAMGFFRDEPELAGILVLTLLSSSVVFLIAAEISDFSLRIWEYFVAEVAYTLAALLLFGGLAWFISARFSFFGLSPILVLLAPSILYTILFVNTARTVYRVRNLQTGETNDQGKGKV